jgi:hypothetical protein
MGYLFNASIGPYETLKIAGLDKVRNDTLRDILIFHYDYLLPRRIELIQDNYSSALIEETEKLEQDLFNFKIIKEGKKKAIEISSYKFDDPKHPLFLNYLNLRIRNIESGKNNFSNYISDSKKVIDLLLKEFKNRNYPKPEYILL